MFSRSIVDSDAFLDMPLSAQALYFHLGMNADDDGFVGNPRRVQRVIGCNDDDLKLLSAKKFIINFPSGVVVIKHHRMNNNWDKHNCKRTVYLEELNSLYIKKNKAYSLDSSKGKPVQSENRLETVFRIEENRIEETTAPQSGEGVYTITSDLEEEKKPKRKKKVTPEIEAVFKLFKNPAATTWRLREVERVAAQTLHDTYGLEVLQRRITRIEKEKANGDPYFPEVNTPSQLLDKMPNIERYLSV